MAASSPTRFPFPRRATYVWGERRMGLYFDGKLVAEGRDVDSHTVLTALGVPVEHKSMSSGWFEKRGYLPAELAEVVFMKETV